jgi:hypothetical protein
LVAEHTGVRFQEETAMQKAIFVLMFLVLMKSSGCDRQKKDERIRSLESEVQELKADVIQLKLRPPEHRYELRANGLRTWRFDPATGDTCIQLTSEADWKRKETKSQSCNCADTTQYYVQMPNTTEALQRLADHYYDSRVKAACGE